jgi:Glycosyltransferase sugar-binding region containing DXD motif
MIPKIIHYIWFGDWSKKPTERIDSWRRMLPEWEIKEWNESNLDITKYKFSKIAYDMGVYGLAIDTHRTEIMFKCGGVWLDTDVIIHEDISPFLKYSFFIGYADTLSFSEGLFGVEPEHPLMSHTLRLALEGWESTTVTQWTLAQLYQTASQSNCETAIRKTLRRDGVILNGKSITLKNNMRLESPPVFTIKGDYGVKNYAEHLYEGSWFEHDFDFNHKLHEAYKNNTYFDFGKVLNS